MMRFIILNKGKTRIPKIEQRANFKDLGLRKFKILHLIGAQNSTGTSEYLSVFQIKLTMLLKKCAYWISFVHQKENVSLPVSLIQSLF